jgi:hypothetical protein
MNYYRVLPRDLFNEANLLKCLGRLSLLIHDGKLPRWDCLHDGGAFDIEQDESDGSLFVKNVRFTVGGHPIHLYRPLNSREPWPLLTEDCEPVFDDEGNVILIKATA